MLHDTLYVWTCTVHQWGKVVTWLHQINPDSSSKRERISHVEPNSKFPRSLRDQTCPALYPAGLSFNKICGHDSLRQKSNVIGCMGLYAGEQHITREIVSQDPKAIGHQCYPTNVCGPLIIIYHSSPSDCSKLSWSTSPDMGQSHQINPLPSVSGL